MRSELMVHELGHALINSITLTELGCDLPINISMGHAGQGVTGIRYGSHKGTTLHWAPSNRTATNALSGALAGALFDLLGSFGKSGVSAAVQILREDLNDDDGLISFVSTFALKHHTLSQSDLSQYQSGSKVELDVLRRVVEMVFGLFDYPARMKFLGDVVQFVELNKVVEFMPGELLEFVVNGNQFDLVTEVGIGQSELKCRYMQAVLDNRQVFSPIITDLISHIPAGTKVRAVHS